MPSIQNADLVSPPIIVLPPLEPGDRLTRAEFERRYEVMPHVKKAELIEGEVYMPISGRFRRHGLPRFSINCWLGNFHAATRGVEGANHASVRLDLYNELQPDGVLFIDPSCGGQAQISEDDFIAGAPELVAEVSASSVSFDLHTKMEVYQRHGVREYIVWRALEQAIDWFVLQDDRFVPMAADADGILRSRVFPGLWLDTAALVRDDLARVLAVVQEGIASPEHQDFVTKLAARRKVVR